MISGRTELFTWAVAGISGIAFATDLLWKRIFNWLTVPALVAGLGASLYFLGWKGAGDAALGALAGLLLYGWMFWAGAMGGGDVKLLMALGAWGGARYAEEVAVLAVLVGGAMALLILAFSGRLPGFLRRMHRFVLTLVVRELEVEAPKVDRKLKMPFGVPIAVAAVWVAFAHPLSSWGMPLWP